MLIIVFHYFLFFLLSNLWFILLFLWLIIFLLRLLLCFLSIHNVSGHGSPQHPVFWCIILFYPSLLLRCHKLEKLVTCCVSCFFCIQYALWVLDSLRLLSSQCFPDSLRVHLNGKQNKNKDEWSKSKSYLQR